MRADLTKRTAALITAVAAAAGAAGCASGAHQTTFTVSSCPHATDTIGGPSHLVRVSQDSYWGHAEPDIAANPRNPAELLAASQVELGPHIRVPASYSSADGGRTWRRTMRLPLPAGYVQGADTTVAFGADGTGYVAATVVPARGAGYPSQIHRGAVVMWRTVDGGRSFAAPVVVFQGTTLEDHPWLAVDPAAAGPTGMLDVAWTDNAGLRFSQSRDGGRTFSAASVLIPSPAPLDPVVAIAHGSVLVFYQELQAQTITLHVLRSADHGASFGPPVMIGSAAEAALPSATPGDKSKTFIPLFAAATSGAAYAAISGYSRAAGHPQILIWASANNGASWSRPLTLNDPATASSSQLQPRLAISLDGTVSLLYFAQARNGMVTANLAQSPGGVRHFQAGRRLDTFCAGPNEWLGDYQGLSATRSAAIAVWNSQRAGRLELVTTTLPAKPYRS